MKLRAYLWNKKLPIGAAVFVIISIYVMGYAFKANWQYQNALVLLIVVFVTVSLVSDYIKRKRFYENMLGILDKLEEKYLINEMIKKPDFPDGEIMCEVLYDTDKAMKEKINEMEISVKEFTEYLEMWIHEVKVPLASLDLMNYNESVDFKGQRKQIDRLKAYVEQILFYARAGASEKDYLMKKCNIEQLVNGLVKENKELIIENKIKITKEELDVDVITDSKWLLFMLGQILNNSIKYLIVKDGTTDKTIGFSAEKNEEKVILKIWDNGIGINEKDLPRVFEKSFTGENGRKLSASTGMGLYICKKLCDKLGHTIEIKSEEGSFTEVELGFGIDKYYEFR